MSEVEIYDKVAVAVPDYDYTLTIKAQGNVSEDWERNQTLLRADDNSRQTITHGGAMFFVNLQFNQLSASDSGVIVDLYWDDAKAKGQARSFKWVSHDGHTYVVYFACKVTRSGNAMSRMGITGLRFEVKGKIFDA